MKRLGRIERIADKQLLLIKIEDTKKIPRIGDKVYGPDLGVLGKILDIIGRVEEPYAVVKPFRKDVDVSRMIGDLTYVKTVVHREKKGRRYSKRKKR